MQNPKSDPERKREFMGGKMGIFRLEKLQRGIYGKLEFSAWKSFKIPNPTPRGKGNLWRKKLEFSAQKSSKRHLGVPKVAPGGENPNFCLFLPQNPHSCLFVPQKSPFLPFFFFCKNPRFCHFSPWISSFLPFFFFSR